MNTAKNDDSYGKYGFTDDSYTVDEDSELGSEAYTEDIQNEELVAKLGPCLYDSAGTPYWEFGMDGSIGTWTTNIPLALCLLLLYPCMTGVQFRPSALGRMHTARWSVGLGCMFRGVVAFFGVFFHGHCADPSNNCRQAMYVLVSIFMALSGACFCITAHSFITYSADSKKYRKPYIIFVIIFLAVGIGSAWLPAVYGALLFRGVPLFALYVIISRHMACPGWCPCWPRNESHAILTDKKAKRGFYVTCLGFGLLLSASCVQVFLSGRCGVRCPHACPLPAPNFNHNALAHVLCIPAYSVLCFGIDMLVPRLGSVFGELGSELDGKLDDKLDDKLDGKLDAL